MNSHVVYFYEEGVFWIENVANFVKKGFEQEETAIVITTAEQRADLITKLLADNVIGLLAPRGGNYVTLDASTTVSCSR